MNTNKAIILGCDYGGLAVAKSMKSHSVEPLVLTHDPEQGGLQSRHVRDWRSCPPPFEEEALVSSLMGYAGEWEGAVIFPTSDAYEKTVARHRSELSTKFIVAVADWELTRGLGPKSTHAPATSVQD